MLKLNKISVCYHSKCVSNKCNDCLSVYRFVTLLYSNFLCIFVQYNFSVLIHWIKDPFFSVK